MLVSIDVLQLFKVYRSCEFRLARSGHRRHFRSAHDWLMGGCPAVGLFIFGTLSHDWLMGGCPAAGLRSHMIGRKIENVNIMII